MGYPKIVRLRQRFERPRVEDVGTAVASTLERLDLGRRIRPGQTVALTAGSRGIANIPVVLRETAGFLKKLGARPFLIPAMGSHGGGTAEGQRRILESYGVTEAFVGAPIRASMDVATIGSTPEGFPVYLDKLASQADHIGVVARIKPHTGFHGPIESGLLKMMMIGLGKHVGALAYHRILLEQPYGPVVRSVGRVMCSKAPIAFGLALVENAYDETALIEAVGPDQFEPREEHLLCEARRMLPRLPWRQADLLIVDEIGKNISGSGMDTNVVGRKRAFRQEPPPDQPAMRLIFVRGLSNHTHGNAAGIGLADFTTVRLVKAMNYRATVVNCLTSGYPEGANLPVHFETDRETIDAALAIIGTRPPEEARVLHIRNTLHVEEVEASEPCFAEPAATDVTRLGEARPLAFDEHGDLPPI
ncbi:MAG TPA: lactate racemase domain-containing protein [Gemmataceae bacterium]|nr:lactate racemase domain-containing protein [Gemmataceae bacterium]